jgi:hypothetical protein
MRKITYNPEKASWYRNNYLLRTILFPFNDDNNNKLEIEKTRTDKTINQGIPLSSTI